MIIYFRYTTRFGLAPSLIWLSVINKSNQSITDFGGETYELAFILIPKGQQTLKIGPIVFVVPLLNADILRSILAINMSH